MVYSSVITSAYLNQNVAETFDGNGWCHCFVNSPIITNIYLYQNKVGNFGSNGKCLCLMNFFVVMSVYFDRLNPKLLEVMPWPHPSRPQ